MDQYDDIPDDLEEMPETDESEVVEADEATSDPDDREVHTGVGFHDDQADQLDRDVPESEATAEDEVDVPEHEEGQD